MMKLISTLVLILCITSSIAKKHHKVYKNEAKNNIYN